MFPEVRKSGLRDGKPSPVSNFPESVYITSVKNIQIQLKNVFLLVLLMLTLGISAQVVVRDGIDSLQSLLDKAAAKRLKSSHPELTLKDSNEVWWNYKIALRHYYRYSDEGIPYAEKGLAMSRKIGFLDGVNQCANLLSIFYINLSRYPEAEKYLKISLDAAIRLKNQVLQVDCLCNMTVFYAQQSNHTEALKHALRAIRLAKKINYYEGIIASYNNAGAVYKGAGQLDEALAQYREVLAFQKKRRDDFTACVTQQNIGEIYVDSNQSEKAMSFYNEGLRLAIKSGNKESQANNLSGIARVFEARKEYGQALKKQSEALAIRIGIDDKYGIANSYIVSGKLHSLLGNEADALIMAKKGIALSEELGIPELTALAASLLSDLYAKKGDYRKAYDYHVKFQKVNDSVFNMEKDKKLTELRLKYEFREQQDAQKLAQQKKDAVNELRRKKSRNTLYFILLALLLVIVFAFYILNDLKKTRRQQRIIENQKEQIQVSLNEKETLLREIHHRVKNNLQIISSLLNIQSSTIQDENVLSSIQEGQRRVQAMSLIHQNLYQSEKVSNVDIDNYLRELVDYLAGLYETESRAITTEIATEGIEFDIDTAIPLGLIVNELVSNAYKYAFRSVREGTIAISISHKTGNEYVLKVSNDGEPLPDGFDVKSHKSLGLKLVSILSRQLRGSFSVEAGKRTNFIVSFRDMKGKSDS